MLISVGRVCHAQFGEEATQQRIRPLVVHDEPGVNGLAPSVGSDHVVGVRMAPKTIG